MAKSLIKLVLLGALSAGASNLPGLLGGMSQLKSGAAPDFAMPAGKDESSRELRREMADLGQTMSDLKALAGGGAGPRAVSGLSDEERELMQDAAPQLKFRDNALTRTAGLAGGNGAAAGALPELPGAAGMVMGRLKSSKGPDFQTFGDFRDDLLKFYRGHQAQAAYALWLIPGAAVALSFLLFLCKRYTLSMLLTGLLFSLTSGVLWMLSASIVLSGFTKQALLGVLPRELWLSPVVFLVVSAGLLRLADENYPFWNKTVSALTAPIGASLLAAYWPVLLAKAKGALAAKAGA